MSISLGLTGAAFLALSLGLGINVHIGFGLGFGAVSAAFVIFCIISGKRAADEFGRRLSGEEVRNRLDNAMNDLRQSMDSYFPRIQPDENAHRAVIHYFNIQTNYSQFN